MKVSSSNWNISGATRAYRQIRSHLQPEGQSTNVQVSKGSAKTLKAALQPTDILSTKERATLHALFSGNEQIKMFYGNKPVRSIQSGFLLDLKG